MKKEEEKVEYDLSKLSLQELILVYQQITEFMVFINESKIEIEEEKEDNE